jgi:hypothetical protein
VKNYKLCKFNFTYKANNNPKWVYVNVFDKLIKQNTFVQEIEMVSTEPDQPKLQL